jgi:hypothetical protein
LLLADAEFFRNLSVDVCQLKILSNRRGCRFVGNAVDAYGPSTINPATHRTEQIVLWMDVIRALRTIGNPRRIARQDKGGSMALR